MSPSFHESEEERCWLIRKLAPFLSLPLVETCSTRASKALGNKSILPVGQKLPSTGSAG
jgi:hypothetical protein